MPRMLWSCVISPPTSVQLSCGRTASISATFGHGAPHPPGGLDTLRVGRSTTESRQRIVQVVEPDPTLARVQRLSEVESGEHGACTSQLGDHVQIHGGRPQREAPVVVADQPMAITTAARASVARYPSIEVVSARPSAFAAPTVSTISAWSRAAVLA